jgi:hypothetical protein
MAWDVFGFAHRELVPAPGSSKQLFGPLIQAFRLEAPIQATAPVGTGLGLNRLPYRSERESF